MDLREANGQPARRVVIELAPAFAPVHVANIRAFTRAGWWNRSGIYRVQDNYVAQWGNGETSRGMPAAWCRCRRRNTTAIWKDNARARLAIAMPMRPPWGIWRGGRWRGTHAPGRVNLTHCYGMVGVGRGEAPDTGSGGELYAVIGHAPRHLDRNIAAVGRVIDGMDALSARPRGTEALGFYKARSSDIPIARVTLAADLPRGAAPGLRSPRYRQRRVRTLCGRARQSSRQFFCNARRRRGHLQRPRADPQALARQNAPEARLPTRRRSLLVEKADQAAQACSVRILRWRTSTGAGWDIVEASASGSAVAQNAHSALVRPIYQCVRPQPGQWFTSASR
jgi:cyclophilin family peptidyl-prolyl cis-trans isomerase